jgi:hypothetical protein
LIARGLQGLQCSPLEPSVDVCVGSPSQARNLPVPPKSGPASVHRHLLSGDTGDSPAAAPAEVPAGAGDQGNTQTQDTSQPQSEATGPAKPNSKASDGYGSGTFNSFRSSPGGTGTEGTRQGTVASQGTGPEGVGTDNGGTGAGQDGAQPTQNTTDASPSPSMGTRGTGGVPTGSSSKNKGGSDGQQEGLGAGNTSPSLMLPRGSASPDSGSYSRGSGSGANSTSQSSGGSDMKVPERSDGASEGSGIKDQGSKNGNGSAGTARAAAGPQEAYGDAQGQQSPSGDTSSTSPSYATGNDAGAGGQNATVPDSTYRERQRVSASLASQEILINWANGLFFKFLLVAGAWLRTLLSQVSKMALGQAFNTVMLSTFSGWSYWHLRVLS